MKRRVLFSLVTFFGLAVGMSASSAEAFGLRFLRCYRCVNPACCVAKDAKAAKAAKAAPKVEASIWAVDEGERELSYGED